MTNDAGWWLFVLCWLLLCPFLYTLYRCHKRNLARDEAAIKTAIMDTGRAISELRQFIEKRASLPQAKETIER